MVFWHFLTSRKCLTVLNGTVYSDVLKILVLALFLGDGSCFYTLMYRAVFSKNGLYLDYFI